MASTTSPTISTLNDSAMAYYPCSSCSQAPSPNATSATTSPHDDCYIGLVLYANLHTDGYKTRIVQCTRPLVVRSAVHKILLLLFVVLVPVPFNRLIDSLARIPHSLAYHTNSGPSLVLT